MEFEIKKMSEWQKENAIKGLMHFHDEFYYRKVRNKYQTYCFCCNTYNTVDESQFKQIRYSKICPTCLTEIRKIKEYHECVIISSNVVDVTDGWYIQIKWRFGKEPKITFEDYTLHRDEKSRIFVRNIKLYYYSYYTMSLKYLNEQWYPDLIDKWKRTRSENYINASLEIRYRDFKFDTKKQSLEKLLKGKDIKSNQKKLMIDNLFNEEQIQAIVYFDLKTAGEVYKHRKYIRDNKYSMSYKQTFNYATLHYLWKNKISLSDYKDYARLCKELGRKLDKPKDFELWHDRLLAIKNIAENQKYEAGIKKVYKKLSKFNKFTKKYTIKTFENVEEICIVSKHLHNCMSRLYVEPFSKGKTELWYLAIDGKPEVAIEVNKNRLIQCRGDHNKEPNTEYKRYVNQWLKERIATV